MPSCLIFNNDGNTLPGVLVTRLQKSAFFHRFAAHPKLALRPPFAGGLQSNDRRRLPSWLRKSQGFGVACSGVGRTQCAISEATAPSGRRGPCQACARSAGETNPPPVTKGSESEYSVTNPIRWRWMGIYCKRQPQSGATAQEPGSNPEGPPQFNSRQEAAQFNETGKNLGLSSDLVYDLPAINTRTHRSSDCPTTVASQVW